MLNEKYHPKDMMSRVMQKRELNVLTLEASKDPDKCVMNISCLKIEYKHKLSEEDKVTALVRAAGPKYANTIFNKTILTESKGSSKLVIYSILIQRCLKLK